MNRQKLDQFTWLSGSVEDKNKIIAREKVARFTGLLNNLAGCTFEEIKDEDFMNFLQILICTDQEILHYENMRGERALRACESEYLLEAVFFNSILSLELMNVVSSGSFMMTDYGGKIPILMENNNIDGLIKFDWDKTKSNRVLISFDDPKGHEKTMNRMMV